MGLAISYYACKLSFERISICMSMVRNITFVNTTAS